MDNEITTAVDATPSIDPKIAIITTTVVATAVGVYAYLRHRKAKAEKAELTKIVEKYVA